MQGEVPTPISKARTTTYTLKGHSPLASPLLGCCQACWVQYKMSSNKFLQRFQGKIHIIGKAGIQGLFGDKDTNVTVYTNNNFYQQAKNKTATSLNKARLAPNQPKISHKTIAQPNQGAEKRSALKMPSIHSKPSQRHSLLEHDANNLNDQQDQYSKKEPLLLDKHPSDRHPRDIRRATNYNSSRSLQKRNSEEYTKSGGLGANIGGEEWALRKKKLDKMQLFSEQVKLTNTRPKIPKQHKNPTHFPTEEKGNTEQEGECTPNSNLD